MCVFYYKVLYGFLYPKVYIWLLQVSDYNMQPDTAQLAEQVKTCLQESDDIPRDITMLFDNSLFRLDTSVVPKVLK